jgi:hypothetical protein
MRASRYTVADASGDDDECFPNPLALACYKPRAVIEQFNHCNQTTFSYE